MVLRIIWKLAFVIEISWQKPTTSYMHERQTPVASKKIGFQELHFLKSLLTTEKTQRPTKRVVYVPKQKMPKNVLFLYSL